LKNYFKIPVFFLSLWPIYIITYQLFNNELGPEPVDRIINHFGEWTLIFVLLTLSMTPLRKITNSLEWIRFRRMLGLFAFFYASIHMLSYVGLDYRFDFKSLINDLLKKKFVFIGFSAWLLLIPLAITSSDKMVRILKKNWKKLHRLVYVISIFGVLHFIWLSKTIFFKPLIFLIILIILLLFRINFNKSVSKI
jgi:sulfoxide reductase heme-binding subunit YedZ